MKSLKCQCTHALDCSIIDFSYDGRVRSKVAFKKCQENVWLPEWKILYRVFSPLIFVWCLYYTSSMSSQRDKVSSVFLGSIQILRGIIYNTILGPLYENLDFLHYANVDFHYFFIYISFTFSNKFPMVYYHFRFPFLLHFLWWLFSELCITQLCPGTFYL